MDTILLSFSLERVTIYVLSALFGISSKHTSWLTRVDVFSDVTFIDRIGSPSNDSLIDIVIGVMSCSSDCSGISMHLRPFCPTYIG